MTITAQAGGTFRITPLGPYSWELSSDFATSWPSMRHQSKRCGDGIAMAFVADKILSPVAVKLVPRDGGITGEIAGWAGARPDPAAVAAQVARVLSLDHDARSYPAVGERDPEVGKVMAALPGLRPVNFCSPYECAAWAVMSARISQNQVAVIKGKLIATYGTSFEVDGVTVGAIPTPQQMLAIGDFPSLAAVKVERLRAVAQAAQDGLLDAEYLISLGERASEAVRVIPGIGAFWSQGIYMRTCSVTDVWPAEPLSDAALGAIHGLGDQPSAADIERLTEAFRPWRTWVCVLLRFAAGRGFVPDISGREGAIRAAGRESGAYEPRRPSNGGPRPGARARAATSR